MKLQPISLSTIPDAIIRQIRALVAEGRLQPGDRLPNERELGEQFGVGRSSVREAMMALAATGMVVRRREGTFINPDSTRVAWASLDGMSGLTRSTIKDVFETRRLFEVGIAALAAERATPATIAEIKRWLPENLNDLEAFKQADVQFHKAVAKAADNPFTYELYGKVQEILFQTHQYYTALQRLDPDSSVTMYQSVLDQHREILRAIEAHDPTQAQQAVLAHFDALEETMLHDVPPDSDEALASALDAGADADLPDDEGDEADGATAP